MEKTNEENLTNPVVHENDTALEETTPQNQEGEERLSPENDTAAQEMNPAAASEPDAVTESEEKPETDPAAVPSRESAEEEQTKAEEPKAEEAKAEEAPTRKKSKIVPIAAAAVLLIAAVIAAFLLTGNMRKYSAARKLYDSGKYEEACQAFQQLGDYKDASDLVVGCKYHLAKAQMEDGKYEEAAKALQQLGDYEDAKDLILGCNYQIAKAQMKAGKYEEAAKAFQALDDYQDSRALFRECRYQTALALMEKKQYAEARKIFEECGDDASLEKAKECSYLVAKQEMDKENFDKAREMFLELGSFRDAQKLADECRIAFSPEKMNAKMLEIFRSKGIDVRLVKDKSLYYVYVNNENLGSFSYNHMEKMGNALDEGVINHITAIFMVFNADDLEYVHSVWRVIAPAIMCASDPAFKDDLETAYAVAQSYMDRALSNGGDNVEFTNNGIRYHAAAVADSGYALFAFGAWKL